MVYLSALACRENRYKVLLSICYDFSWIIEALKSQIYAAIVNLIINYSESIINNPFISTINSSIHHISYASDKSHSTFSGSNQELLLYVTHRLKKRSFDIRRQAAHLCKAELRATLSTDNLIV